MRTFPLLLALLFTTAFADPKNPTSLSDLPAAAQKTVRQHIGSNPVSEIERRTEDGDTVYDVTFTRNDEEREMTVAEDGILLSIEVSLGETPPAVQKSVQQQLKGATLDEVEKNFDEGQISYVVSITRGNLEQTFEVAPDGKLLRLEITLPEAPLAVRKTITSHGGTPGNIFKVFEDGEVFYDLDITKDGQERELSVAADGKLLSEEVFLTEVPKPAQKTINNRVGKGSIHRIDKCFGDKNEVTYEVMAKRDGKHLDFSVGPRGRFLGMNK